MSLPANPVLLWTGRLLVVIYLFLAGWGGEVGDRLLGPVAAVVALVLLAGQRSRTSLKSLTEKDFPEEDRSSVRQLNRAGLAWMLITFAGAAALILGIIATSPSTTPRQVWIGAATVLFATSIVTAALLRRRYDLLAARRLP